MLVFDPSGVQECHVGLSPKPWLAVLILPTPDSLTLLVIRWREAIMNPIGYGRHGGLDETFPIKNADAGGLIGMHCTMLLFMDALELDEYDLYRVSSGFAT
jgi:hypothetical protein